MKAIRLFTTAVTFLFTALASAGPAILYVSENGEKSIAIYSIDEATGELTRAGAVDLPGAPGSLALDPKRAHLYAAVRSGKQFVTLTINPATGGLSDPVFSPAGIDAAYVQVDRTGKWLLAASYGEGVVTVNRIIDGVVTGAPIQTVATGKKAHCVQFAPGNRFAFVPHVGELNKVEQFRFDATTGTLSPNTPPSMPGGEGEGPRHMQFHPNGRWVYLVNEQGQSVTLCDYDANDGTLKIRQTLSTTPETWDKSKGSCADIHISADGRFAYASNRGHDSLAVFAIHAETGELKSLGQTPTEKTPRSFCLMPGGEKYVVSAGRPNFLLIFTDDHGYGDVAAYHQVLPIKDTSPHTPFEMSIEVSNSGLARFWYGAPIGDFLASDANEILGKLSRHAGDGHFSAQRDSWLAQIDLLRAQLKGLEGWVFFEFNIPRMGRRVDVILVIGSVIFALEFKVGETTYDRQAIDQVWDYALDLKNFHEASHNVAIAPILVATGANPMPAKFEADADDVYRPVLTNAENLRDTLELGLSIAKGSALDAHTWARASYRPTPTIIEAARSLYAQHSVESIARFDAGAQNLHTTSKRIEELVDEARSTGQKFICFVTGVPGAGKTLVGLNIATQRRDEKVPTHAVFLSGNGPLVAVLREALTRDEYLRLKARKQKVTKKKIATPVKAFIQNVHHFRDAGLTDENAPPEHVVIFDEAQRAWNSQMTANFMKRKKGRPGFTQSEPEFLISYMDRHQDWAVIICLVGGGQEINTGEAGISAWLDAVIQHFPHWKMFISSRLHDSEYAANNSLELAQRTTQTHHEDSLHLAVSMRSFRAENVSAFVKALLDCEPTAAREAFAGLSVRFPIVLARDLDKAKQWVRSRARGSERFGLLASSKAMRLKPHAVDIRVDVDPVHYFLNDRNDVRSSYYLEDAATEFQVQGLELDWTCVTWDADFRFNGSGWNYHDFRGSSWTNIKNSDNRSYLRNAYRVLLTRARQGMVVFVPPGNANDPTRAPAFYDSTFNYLRELGIPALV